MQLKPAVGMARISDEHKQGDGFSKDLQLDRLRQDSERAGFRVTKVFVIEETGFKPLARPKFAEVKAYIEMHPNVEALVVDRIDRFARNYTDLGWAMETARNGKGVEVFALAERVSSVYHAEYFGMFMSVAKAYSQRLRDRALADMPELAKQGRWLYKAPPGYANVSKDKASGGHAQLVVDKQMSWIVKEFFHKYAHEGFRGMDLVRWARDNGIKTAKGNPFSKTTIYRLLKHRVYLGEVVWRDQWYPGNHPALIGLDTFNAVQERMAQRSGANNPNRLGKKRFLLKQVPMSCEYCGGPLTAQYTKGNGGTYIYYFCSRKSLPDCRRAYSQDILFERVGEIFDGIKLPKQLLTYFERNFDSVADNILGRTVDNAAALKNQLETLDKQIDRAAVLAISGDGENDDVFLGQLKRLRSERLQVEKQLALCSYMDKADIGMAKEFVDWASDLGRAYQSETDGLIKVGLVQTVASNLTIGQEKVRAEYNNPFNALVGFEANDRVGYLATLVQTIVPALKSAIKTNPSLLNNQDWPRLSTA